MRKFLYMLAVTLLLAGCSNDEGFQNADLQQGERWYTQAQVKEGRQLYKDNCASCHGGFGQGARNWRQADERGRYPAPPLNGTGHAWHHPLDQLRDVIQNGRPENIPSDMPAWGDKLSEKQIDAVIAWFQSRWPERIYDAWVKRNHR